MPPGEWIFIDKLNHGDGGVDDMTNSDAHVWVVFRAPGVRRRLWRGMVVKLWEVQCSDWTLLGRGQHSVALGFRRGRGPMEHNCWWAASLRLAQSNFRIPGTRARDGGLPVLRGMRPSGCPNADWR